MPKIIINSVDSFGEKISQKIIAKKTINDDITTYTYDNKYGQGEIRISPYFAEILKFGEVQSKLLIKPNSETEFLYNASYFKKNFKVFCKKYLYSENKLTIAYVIYDNNVEINQLEIEIIEVQ
ncbi:MULTISPECIES: DUF1934 family protein [Cetobacterium]|jgi:hypothetical protein|uniref:DUF1934 family protein n=1 Tax=Candidatus Cetobacterium colombiensis TaxID=3073100 RepID=A0ABU4WCV3_9FUSO|nr:DUF1934 family protein [Candidatus Cetobacterium colombiensis]MDX8336220.1 DUF1934 family protein [Candidatus Cetobacterium colombiensis]